MGEQLARKGETPDRLAAEHFFLLALFVAVVHVGWWFFGDSVVAAGGFYDGDSYMRLLRVERLIETGAWFDSSIPRANWPYGASLHWTRLFDVILIALALPLAPVIGLGKALFWSGMIVSPILHVLTGIALAWAAWPILGRAGAIVAGALTATQLGVVGYAVAGHADHHVLFGLFAVIAFGATVRVLMDLDRAGKYARWAGFALGAGLWVGPEAQIIAVLCLTAVALHWVVEGDAKGVVIGNLRLMFGLAVAVALALLIERGVGGFLDVEYDRVSVVHLTPAVLVLAFWEAVATAGRRDWTLKSPGARLAAGAAAAAAVIAITWALFPKVVRGPIADVDPIWQMIDAGVGEAIGVGDTARFLLYMGAVLFAGPWALWRLKQEWPGRVGWAWALLSGVIAIYVAFAYGWIRWSLYAGLFMMVALADLVMWVDSAVDRRFAGAQRIFVKTGAMMALIVGPVIAAAGLQAGLGKEEAGATPSCPVQAMARQLNGPPWADHPRTILASVNFGPEILYRTKHRVLTTIHHRSYKGFFDAVGILGGIDEAEILDLIGKRQVDLILICPGSAHDRYFIADGGGDVLYRRLERGELPGWLAEVPLPADLGVSFKLFRVSPPG